LLLQEAVCRQHQNAVVRLGKIVKGQEDHNQDLAASGWHKRERKFVAIRNHAGRDETWEDIAFEFARLFSFQAFSKLQNLSVNTPQRLSASLEQLDNVLRGLQVVYRLVLPIVDRIFEVFGAFVYVDLVLFNELSPLVIGH